MHLETTQETLFTNIVQWALFVVAHAEHDITVMAASAVAELELGSTSAGTVILGAIVTYWVNHNPNASIKKLKSLGIAASVIGAFSVNCMFFRRFAGTPSTGSELTLYFAP